MQQTLLFSKEANDFVPTRATDWRLDERTKEHGRAGVRAAREALARCHPVAA